MEVSEQRTAAPPTQAAGGVKDKKSRWRGDLAGWGFVLPFLVIYGLFILWPILLQVRMSFFDASLAGVGSGAFLGLGNYIELFGDPDFLASLWHTVLFTLLTTPPLVFGALVLALLVNRIRFAQWFFRTAFFAPFVVPVSVMSLIWIWLYQPGFGLVNGYLARINADWANIGWLTNADIALVSMAIATVWWTIGFNFVLYLAGLQEIPQDVYDAAATDGATSWNQTRFITIPLLARTTVLVLVLQILNSLKVFQQTYLLANQTGGPNFSTRGIIEYFYTQGFTNYRMGYASAMANVFFVLVILIAAAWFLINSRRGESV